MSQPKMRRGDLSCGRDFPPGDWGEPAERLDELCVWVEQRAQLVSEWYLANRVWKRRGARMLRAGAAAGVTAGAALPLLTLTGRFGGWYAAWGYLALLGAALCLGADRWFGLTTGWMRDVATAQAVQRRLESFRYDWAVEAVREVLGPTEGSVSESAGRSLSVLRRFTEDVTEIVRAETADWMLELRSRTAPHRLPPPVPPPGPTGDGHSVTNGYRFHIPPGTRPSMPRQRPPETPH